MENILKINNDVDPVLKVFLKDIIDNVNNSEIISFSFSKNKKLMNAILKNKDGETYTLTIEKQGNDNILSKDITVGDNDNLILNLYHCKNSSAKEIAEMFMLTEAEVYDIINKYKLMPLVEMVDVFSGPTLKPGFKMDTKCTNTIGSSQEVVKLNYPWGNNKTKESEEDGVFKLKIPGEGLK